MSNMTRSPISTSDNVSRRFGFLVNFAYYGIIIAIALLALSGLFKWMLPFVFAFIVATILQRPLNWLVKKTKVSIKFFSVIFVVAIILLLAGLVAFIGWRLFVFISDFVSNKDNIEMISNTIKSASSAIQGVINNISGMLSDDMVETLNTAITGSTNKLVDSLSAIFTNAPVWAANTIAALPMVLVSFIMWVAASIFLTIDYKKVTGFILNQIPERHTEIVNTTRELCSDTLFKLLRAYLLLMFITFVELAIGLTVLHVSHSIILAALICVVDILPVLGTGTVVIPWALISLAMGNSKLFIGLLLLYIIILIVRNIIEPRVISNQIGLNPLVTLFFMFLGLRTVGILGMMLFPVVVMVLAQLQKSGKISIWK